MVDFAPLSISQTCHSGWVHKQLTCRGECQHKYSLLVKEDPTVHGLPTYKTGNKSGQHAHIALSFSDFNEGTEEPHGFHMNIEGELIVPNLNGTEWEDVGAIHKADWLRRIPALEACTRGLFDKNHDPITRILYDRITTMKTMKGPPNWADQATRLKFLNGLASSLNSMDPNAMQLPNKDSLGLSFWNKGAPANWKRIRTPELREAESKRLEEIDTEDLQSPPPDSLVSSCTFFGNDIWK